MAISVWEDCLNQTLALIQGLGLTWTPPGQSAAVALASTDILIREMESDENVRIPNIQIVLGGVEQDERGDFEDTETIFPVKVVHTFEAQQSFKLNGDRLLWRQQIYDLFIDQPRPEVTSADVNDCQVSFNPPLELAAFQNQDLQVGGLLLKFRALRSRNRS